MDDERSKAGISQILPMAPGITRAPIWSLICRQPIPCGAPAAAASTMETCLQGEREHRAAELAPGFDSRGMTAPFAPHPALTQLQLCHGTAVKRCSSTLRHQQQGQVLQVTPRFMVTSEIPQKKTFQERQTPPMQISPSPTPWGALPAAQPRSFDTAEHIGGIFASADPPSP